MDVPEIQTLNNVWQQTDSGNEQRRLFDTKL
jgi:hypothetical protein